MAFKPVQSVQGLPSLWGGQVLLTRGVELRLIRCTGK